MWCQTWLQNVNQLQIKARRKINTLTTFFTFSHLRSWSVNSSLQWLSKLIKLWLVHSAAAKNQASRVLWLTLAPRLAAPLRWCWLGFYAIKFKIRTLVLPYKLRVCCKDSFPVNVCISSDCLFRHLPSSLGYKRFHPFSFWDTFKSGGIHFYLRQQMRSGRSRYVELKLINFSR